MTTPTLFSDLRGGNRRYFLGELTRSWPRTVLYLIALFLVMPLPIIFLFTEKSSNGINNIQSSLENCLEAVSLIAIGIAMAAAFLAGCVAMNYLHKKVSSDFHHSLPIRRESLFLTKYAVGLIDFLLALTLNILITFSVIATFSSHFIMNFPLVQGLVWRMFGLALLAFLTVYTFTTLAGILSGTGAMQFILSLYFCFIPFIWFMSFFGLCEMFSTNLNISYYYGTNAFSIRLSPVIRFFATVKYELSFIEVLCYLLLNAALLLLSLWIYRFRRTERAETPIVFDRFAVVFQYSVIWPATVLVGMFLDLLTGSTLWFLFGLILGAVLSFMLSNTILNKNPRQMFKGFRGFAIYAVVFAVLLIGLAANLFGLDSYVPRAGQVKSVTVRFSHVVKPLTYTDKDMIQSVLDLYQSEEAEWDAFEKETVLWEEEEPAYENNAYPASFYYSGYDTSHFNLSLIVKLKNGFPLAYRDKTVSRSDATDFLKRVANSEEYWEELRQIRGTDLGSLTLPNNEKGAYEQLSDDIVTQFLADVDTLTYDTLQEQTVGHLEYRDKTRFWHTIPLTRAFDRTMQALNMDAYCEKLLKSVSYAVVIPWNGNGANFSFSASTVGATVYTEPEQIRQLLKQAATLTYENNVFTEIDTRYVVGFCFASENGYDSTIATPFLAGRVPAFVHGSK